MRRRGTLAIAAALALVGTLGLQYVTGGGNMEPIPVEVELAPLAAGSTGGVNGTNGSVTVGPALIATTTDVLYLNNDNATGTSYARLALRDSSGVSNLVTLTVGIDNGTKTAQITGSLGAITQLTGSLVRLEPSSTNKIYVTQAVTLLTGTTLLGIDVIVADTPAEDAIVKSRLGVTID